MKKVLKDQKVYQDLRERRVLKGQVENRAKKEKLRLGNQVCELYLGIVMISFLNQCQLFVS